MKISWKQSAFTTVELLVTLFVAAAFLTIGYQLYLSTIKDSGETQALVKANNIAYDYLQQYKAKVGATCSAQTPLSNQSTTVTGLSNVLISVDITCPYSPTITSLSKVTVTVKYNNPQKVIYDSTFVSK